MLQTSNLYKGNYCMCWQDIWEKESQQIESCIQNIRLLNEMDSKSTAWRHYVKPYFQKVYKGIVEKKDSFPDKVQDVINSTLEKSNQMVALSKTEDSFYNPEFITTIALAFNTLKVTVDSMTQDVASKILEKVEQSLILLNRIIELNDDYRNKWSSNKTEMDYEKLGQVFFLERGLWSAKVTGAGETDLVFWDVPLNQNEVKSAGGKILLSEWKVVRNSGKINSKIQEAKVQLERYSGGITYGLALEATRFIILVSEKHLHIDKDTILEDGVTYNIRNIIYDPETPSVDSKVRKDRGQT